MKYYEIKVFIFVFCRYEFLDFVDGFYGNLINDNKNVLGMIGMVMRGVGIVVNDLLIVGLRNF